MPSDSSALLRTARSESSVCTGSLNSIDQNVVKNLPELIQKLDATLANLEQASKNANSVISDNRAAISDFSQNGLGQIGPTLAELHERRVLEAYAAAGNSQSAELVQRWNGALTDFDTAWADFGQRLKRHDQPVRKPLSPWR